MASVTETVHIGGPVPTDLAEAFRAVAEKHDRSVSAELRRAIKAHIDRDAADGAAAKEQTG